MDEFRDSELAAQVVAWHNKHPLAMRVEADQIRGIGSVSVPIHGVSDAIEPSLASTGRPSPEPSNTPIQGGLRAKVNQQSAPAEGNRDPLGQAATAEPGPMAGRRSRRTAARAAFDEDFIHPLRPGQIARFAARYGAEHDPYEGSAPTRHVPPVPHVASTAGGVSSRYLRTVAIELDDRRVRLLVSASRWRRPVVIGPRMWSLPRCLAGATLLASFVLLGASGIHMLGQPDSAPLQIAEATPFAEPPPNHVASASDAASASLLPRSSVAAVLAASGAEHSASDSLRRADAATAAPQTQQLPMVAAASAPPPAVMPAPPSDIAVAARQQLAIDLRPRLSSEAAREARQVSDALRAATAQSAPVPTAAAGSASQPGLPQLVPSAPTQVASLTPPPAQTGRPPGQAAASAPAERARSSPPLPAMAAASPQPVGAVPRGAPSYALVARQTRSRAASELLLGLMRDSEVPAGWPSTRTDVIPAANGFRAGWFPFATREEAEAARAHLLRTGLPTEVIEF